MPAQVDAVETALERELQRRAVQNVGQPETVRKIYDASDSSAAKGPAVPNVPPVTAGRMFGDIHNLKEEVAKGGKPEVGTNTVALQKKFSDNFFGKIAKNKYFEGITISVIFLNALAIGVDADFSARNEVPANLYEGDVFFIVLEVFFASYFTFEILIRFLAYRQKCHCLRDGWFVFDLLLVLMMVWETWIMPFVGLDSGLGQLSILRLLRLLRITRMAKLMRAFPQLMMIIKGISAAARAVGWTAILLVIISFTWSILFTNEYHQGHVTDEEMKEWADDDPRKIHEYFGGMDKSMLTLLIMGTILDDVTECADIIHAQNNIWMLAAFIFYILLNSFMMLNMLVGILVEVVGSTAEAESQRTSKEQAAEAILTIFTSMDSDGSGLISKEEFATMKYDANVMTALRDLGIKEKQFDMYVQLLFDLPDKDPSSQGEAAMGLEKLVEALCRLRPGAAVNLLDWSTFKTAVLRSQDEVQERVKKVYRLLRQKSKGGSVPSTPRVQQPIQEQPAQPKSPWKLSNRIMDELERTPSSEILGELQRRLGVQNAGLSSTVEKELLEYVGSVQN